MNENEKNIRIPEEGKDNEAIFNARSQRPNTPPRPAPTQRPPQSQMQRPEGAPPRVRPAGAPQRPAGSTANAAGAGERPMPPRRPQGAPSAGAQRPAPPQREGAVPVQRPRPAEGQAARPVAPVKADPVPKVSPAPPVRRPISPVRPAAPEKKSEESGAGTTGAVPAYKSRRAMPGADGLHTDRGEAKEKSRAFTSAEEKPQKEQAQTSNEKDGADIMIGIVKAMAFMAIVLVISVFISIFVIRIGNDVFAFVKSDEMIEITIDEDETNIKDIARILSDNGVINFPGIFKMYAGMKDDDGKFIAGTYEVSPSMSYDDLRYAFKEQRVTGTTWITIPEGSSVDEIIDIMVEKGIGTREGYIEVVNNLDLFSHYWFVEELKNATLKEGRAYMLEGYLFPDTYEFYNASTEEMVVNKLLARFDEVFVEDYRTKAAELGYTVDEILIIASLIEKEAGRVSDYMYVSSVFHNRLNNPTYYPKLESDATTVYAIQIATGVRPDKITPEDNKFESPYNSYLNAGLIPSAITNPGASAIRYALYPADSNFYYFVTDNYGKTYFASGIVEHNQNIEEVKKVNAEG